MEYVLKYDDLEIVVNSKGAELEKIMYKGKDYMRVRDEYWNRISPILFPIVGNLKDLKTYISGELFLIPQHGIARDSEFKLFKRTNNQLIFYLKYNETTLKTYPYKFMLFVVFRIINKRLQVRINVVNKGKENMYFNVGGHPGFRIPLRDDESFEDYSVEFEKTETFDAPTVEKNGTLNFDVTDKYKDVDKISLNYKLFAIDAIVIPQIKSRWVKLVNKKGKGIKFSFKKFNSLAIWSRPNAPFVCLEPWQGYADRYDSNYDFLTKDDLVRLRKEESYTCEYNIEILD